MLTTIMVQFMHFIENIDDRQGGDFGACACFDSRTRPVPEDLGTVLTELTNKYAAKGR